MAAQLACPACRRLTALAGLLLKRRKTLDRDQKDRQLRDSAALAHVVPGDEQSIKTKQVDSDSSQDSSESGSKPPPATPSSVGQTSWQLWELVTGSAAISEGQYRCRPSCNLRITPLVTQGSVLAFVAGDLGSQYISLGPDDANMKHEDITLCRNEQGRPIKLGQGGFGKVSLFTVSLMTQNKAHHMSRFFVLLQVYKAMKCGVQPIAVKVVHGTDKRQLSAFAKV